MRTSNPFTATALLFSVLSLSACRNDVGIPTTSVGTPLGGQCTSVQGADCVSDSPDSPSPAERHRAPADDLLETGLQGQVPLVDQWSGRSAQGYRRGTRLVGANDIGGRGHNAQLAWLADCAYVSTGGEIFAQTEGDGRLAILDVADPQSPQQVGFIDGSPVWAQSGFSMTTNARRNLLAGMVADGTVLEIYDASDCRKPVLRSQLDLADELGGSVGSALKISSDGSTLYAALCCRITASQDQVLPNSTRRSLAVIDIADPAHPVVTLTWAAAVTGGDDNADLFGIDLAPDGTRAYVTLEGDHHIPHVEPTLGAPTGLMILDTSDIQSHVAHPQIRVLGEMHWLPNETFGMAYSPQWLRIKGKPHLLVTDVSSGGSAFCPWTHARLIDLSDERRPRAVSEIGLEVNDLANCSKTAADVASYGAYHAGVDNPENATIAFVSWSSSGVRFFDVRDPAQPAEMAYYNPPARPVPDPQTGLPAGSSDKYDQTFSTIRYDAAKGHIWFTSANNGFQVVEFTESARK